MLGLNVENKDWVSRRIGSTVNLLLLVSEWKCAHLGKQWKLKVTAGKTQVLKLFSHGRHWKPGSVQKAAIMTWSLARCSRQCLPKKGKRKQTLLERSVDLLYWKHSCILQSLPVFYFGRRSTPSSHLAAMQFSAAPSPLVRFGHRSVKETWQSWGNFVSYKSEGFLPTTNQNERWQHEVFFSLLTGKFHPWFLVPCIHSYSSCMTSLCCISLLKK